MMTLLSVIGGVVSTSLAVPLRVCERVHGYELLFLCLFDLFACLNLFGLMQLLPSFCLPCRIGVVIFCLFACSLYSGLNLSMISS